MRVLICGSKDYRHIVVNSNLNVLLKLPEHFATRARNSDRIDLSKTLIYIGSLMSASLGGEMFNTRLLIAASEREIIEDGNYRRVIKSVISSAREKTEDARRGETIADAFKGGNALLKTTYTSS